MAAPKSGKAILSIKDFGQGHDVFGIGVIKGIISGVYSTCQTLSMLNDNRTVQSYSEG